jgi:hypothetical protein
MMKFSSTGISSKGANSLNCRVTVAGMKKPTEDEDDDEEEEDEDEEDCLKQ